MLLLCADPLPSCLCLLFCQVVDDEAGRTWTILMKTWQNVVSGEHRPTFVLENTGARHGWGSLLLHVHGAACSRCRRCEHFRIQPVQQPPQQQTFSN